MCRTKESIHEWSKLTWHPAFPAHPCTSNARIAPSPSAYPPTSKKPPSNQTPSQRTRPQKHRSPPPGTSLDPPNWPAPSNLAQPALSCTWQFRQTLEARCTPGRARHRGISSRSGNRWRRACYRSLCPLPCSRPSPGGSAGRWTAALRRLWRIRVWDVCNDRTYDDYDGFKKSTAF